MFLVYEILANATLGIERELSDFRSETAVHLKKLDRRVKLIESALDETMVRVENNLPPRN
jgi:hypothetical protein